MGPLSLAFTASFMAFAAAPPVPSEPVPSESVPSPPLAGPSAHETEAAAAPSLVAYDFGGKLRRPEIAPEAAAAALLDLDQPTRDAVETALAQRAAVFDVFVRENIDLLTKFGNASAAGDRLDQLGLAQLAYVELKPLRDQGSLQSVVRGALPPDEAARFDALLDEYWRAVVRECRRQPAAGDAPGGKRRSGVECVIEERLRSLGREIELAFERQLRTGDILFSYLTEGITLRPEQAARIRQAVADVVEQHDVESDKRAQALLGASILAYLDPEQAAAFIQRVKKLSE